MITKLQDRIDRVLAVTALVLAVVAWVLLVIAAVANAQADPEANDPAYWCGDDGVKYEPVSTPYVVPEPEEGTTWTLLVVKAGQTNDTFPNPIPGQGYEAVSGQDISHVILCWETSQVTTTTSSTTTSTTTSPTTTTTTSTTTTMEASTTTTDPATTSSSTTTTDPTTTSTSSTVPTDGSTTTVPPTTTTTIPTLPNTGVDALGLAVLAAFLLGVGTLTVLAFGSRR